MTSLLSTLFTTAPVEVQAKLKELTIAQLDYYAEEFVRQLMGTPNHCLALTSNVSETDGNVNCLWRQVSFTFRLIPEEIHYKSVLHQYILMTGGSVTRDPNDAYAVNILNDLYYVLREKKDVELPPDCYSSSLIYEAIKRKIFDLPFPDPKDHLLTPSNYKPYDLLKILQREIKWSDLPLKEDVKTERVTLTARGCARVIYEILNADKMTILTWKRSCGIDSSVVDYASSHATSSTCSEQQNDGKNPQSMITVNKTMQSNVNGLIRTFVDVDNSNTQTAIKGSASHENENLDNGEKPKSRARKFTKSNAFVKKISEQNKNNKPERNLIDDRKNTISNVKAVVLSPNHAPNDLDEKGQIRKTNNSCYTSLSLEHRSQRFPNNNAGQSVEADPIRDLYRCSQNEKKSETQMRGRSLPVHLADTQRRQNGRVFVNPRPGLNVVNRTETQDNENVSQTKDVKNLSEENVYQLIEINSATSNDAETSEQKNKSTFNKLHKTGSSGNKRKPGRLEGEDLDFLEEDNKECFTTGRKLRNDAKYSTTYKNGVTSEQEDDVEFSRKQEISETGDMSETSKLEDVDYLEEEDFGANSTVVHKLRTRARNYSFGGSDETSELGDINSSDDECYEKSCTLVNKLHNKAGRSVNIDSDKSSEPEDLNFADENDIEEDSTNQNTTRINAKTSEAGGKDERSSKLNDVNWCYEYEKYPTIVHKWRTEAGYIINRECGETSEAENVDFLDEEDLEDSSIVTKMQSKAKSSKIGDEVAELDDVEILEDEDCDENSTVITKMRNKERKSSFGSKGITAELKDERYSTVANKLSNEARSITGSSDNSSEPENLDFSDEDDIEEDSTIDNKTRSNAKTSVAGGKDERSSKLNDTKRCVYYEKYPNYVNKWHSEEAYSATGSSGNSSEPDNVDFSDEESIEEMRSKSSESGNEEEISELDDDNSSTSDVWESSQVENLNSLQQKHTTYNKHRTKARNLARCDKDKTSEMQMGNLDYTGKVDYKDKEYSTRAKKMRIAGIAVATSANNDDGAKKLDLSKKEQDALVLPKRMCRQVIRRKPVEAFGTKDPDNSTRRFAGCAFKKNKNKEGKIMPVCYGDRSVDVASAVRKGKTAINEDGVQDSDMTEDDDEEDYNESFAKKIRRPFCRKFLTNRRVQFSKEEEYLIVRKICEAKAFQYTGGLNLYKDMALSKDFHGKRTGVALNDRFRKYIKPKLQNKKTRKTYAKLCGISSEDLQALIRGMYESKLNKYRNIAPTFKFV